MASYVIDASAVIEYLVMGTHTTNARTLFEQYTSNDLFIIPEFCILECTNVIWKQIRFQNMALSTGQKLLKNLKKLPLTIAPTRTILNVALELGAKHQLAIYDSLYIALAKQLTHPLITLDKPQTRVAHLEQVILKPITDFQ